MRLSAPQLREFADRGYVVVRDVIPPDVLAAASRAIDRLVEEHPARPGHVGQQFYWLDALSAGAAGGSPPIQVEGKGDPGRTPARVSDGTAAGVRAAVRALLYDTALRGLARALVEPGELTVAFDQAQVALTYPRWPHRPGGGHVDGCEYGPDGVPGTFTLLAGVLLSDQSAEDVGNLWVWPGTHRAHAAFFREHGPEALVASGGYPAIARPEPVRVLGGPGDVVLAHYLLAHNSGGNAHETRVRRTAYFRLRRWGHSERWRECLQDELLEFDAVRAAYS